MDTVPVPGFFGARISLYPMTDRYVPLIGAAVEGLKDADLEIETDDVSTFLGGDPDAIWSGVERVFATAARTGDHVVMTLLLSHGCPGETVCAPAEGSPGGGPQRGAPAAGANGRSGVEVTCQWSLYPLGTAGHMDAIYRAIDLTRSAGVHETGRHFVSHLRGDLSDVLGAIRRAFDGACGAAAHVTAHVTLSANSPSAGGRRS